MKDFLVFDILPLDIVKNLGFCTSYSCQLDQKMFKINEMKSSCFDSAKFKTRDTL